MLTSTGTTDQYESELVITSNWTDRSRTIGIRTTIARMPVLAGLLDSLWMRTGPLIARAYGNFNERMAIDHHWEVLDALKRRDGAAARAAICRDILDGNEKMLEYIEMAQAD